MTRRGTQRGGVLILTLWLAIGLSAAALLAGHASVLRYRREAALYASAQTEQAIEGTVRYLQEVLTAAETAGELPDLDTYQAEDLRVGDCRVWILGRAERTDADELVFAFQDEASRLNLNTMSTTDRLTELEQLPGMTAQLAASMVDWRDTDSELTANGAESDTYLRRDPPSTAKDGPFETVDELRLVNGAEPILLTGRDRNRNSLVEDWEKSLAELNKGRFQTVPDMGFLDLFTVYSREPNQDRTSIAGSAQALRSALTTVFGQERGTAIAGAVGTTSVRSVLELCILGGLDETEADTAFAKLTVKSGNTIDGLVNVNTAPLAVLTCLFGEDTATKLVTYREQNPTGLTSPLWLVSALGEEAAKAVGASVTTRSYQVTADIVAVGPNGRSFQRVRFVLDTTAGEPVVVSRRDLTHLGWPLGARLYTELMPRTGEPTL